MLNETHSAFDRALELLMLLRPEPKYVSTGACARDLCLDDERMRGNMQRLRASLKIRGVEVIGKGTAGVKLAITRKTWRRAEAVGQRYWDEVYG